MPVGVRLISLVLALTLPIHQIDWSGWAYFSMAILVPLHSAYGRRRMEAKVEQLRSLRFLLLLVLLLVLGIVRFRSEENVEHRTSNIE
jgi:hypothetical protein